MTQIDAEILSLRKESGEALNDREDARHLGEVAEGLRSQLASLRERANTQHVMLVANDQLIASLRKSLDSKGRKP